MTTDTTPTVQTPASRPVRADARFMLSSPHHFVAQGFGSGLSPVMPGTMGTLLAWVMFIVFSQRWPQLFSTAHWAWIIVLGFAAGVHVCERTGRALGVPDHGSMVWDEMIAFWLVLLFILPADLTTQCWAFFWFRLFDMTKPPPIGWFDRHFKGGFGVMWDDIVAAFFTLLVFTIWRLI